MGVITTCRLDEGVAFGPVPPTMTLADPIVLIGHRTCDTLPDIHTVKLDVLSFSLGVRLAEWVPYVQAARDADEQNMEAVVDAGELYFRVTRSVPANSELLIWYSDKLAARIGVPELREDSFITDHYSCSKCREKFIYPNCLRAHMRFRCKYRQQMVLNQPGDNRKQYGGDAIPQYRVSDPPPVKRKRPDDAGTPSPTRRTGSTAEPGVVDGRLRAGTPTSNGVDDSPAAVESSAFQRVPFQPPPTPFSSPSSPLTSTSGPMTSSAPTSAMNLTTDGAVGAGLFLFPRLMHAPPRALSLGLQPADRLPPAFPTSLAPNELLPVNGLSNNNNNNNNNDSKTAPAGGSSGAAELPTKVGMSQYTSSHPDPRLPMPFVYRTPNPVIDKMLNFFGSAAAVAAAAAGAAAAGGGPMATSYPSLNLAQNWCAKCNTSFRMTSDLVYHMRSHHKREFDPVKRRKDDKLRCEVCGESFRERHHLTRHMTSHS